MHYRDIKTFYNPHQGVDHDWQYLEEWLADQQTVGLDLDPDFQRAHVWDEARQVAYVENRLRDGMAGRTIYINRGPWCWTSKADGVTRWGSPPREADASWQGYGLHVLVDGKQRLTAVLKFLRNELPIFGGHYRKDFEGRLPHQASFQVAYGEFGTRAEIIQWYLDLNAGGVVHTESEIARVRALLAQETGQ